MSPRISTVSEVVSKVKSNLEQLFDFLAVEGEVSNLTSSSSGHYYFTLSDAESSLSAALFKMDAARFLKIRQLKDGDKVCCQGNLSVYSKRGTFQLIVKRMHVVGQGNLLEKFEKLKLELSALGLFDRERKKKLPLLPKRVGVITALQGAALQDFLNVYRRRAVKMDILVIPSLVQGEEAPKELLMALERALKIPTLDVLVLTRGGGSLEDLWAFNDRNLILALSKCPIPIVSAIGHHVDFTLCDFVADVRAETPTAAAELLTEGQNTLIKRWTDLQYRLRSSMEKFQWNVLKRLEKMRPQALMNLCLQKFKEEMSRFKRLEVSLSRIQDLKLTESYLMLDDYQKRLQRSMHVKLEKEEQRFNSLYNLLNTLNPRRNLAQGHALVFDESRNLVSSREKFIQNSSDYFWLEFFDGECKIEKCDKLSKE